MDSLSGRDVRVAAAFVAAALIVAMFLAFAGTPATAAADRVEPKFGLYRGKTAQGASISFYEKNGRVVRPSYTVVHRGCGQRITFTTARRINRKNRFFFGRRASDFFTGGFSADGKVRGRAGIDFSGGTCPGRGVHEVRFRARRVS